MIRSANPDPAMRAAMEDAALVESFDPIALAGSDTTILGELAAVSDEIVTDKALAWRLRSDARQTLLTVLAGSDRLDAALERHAGADDPFSRYLAQALRGEPLAAPPDSQAERETAIVAYEVATASLTGVGAREPTLRMAREDLANLRTQSALDVERRRSETILSGPLIGRVSERQALVRYIETGMPDPEHALPPPKAPQLAARPFLITGCAGAGKSALLADIIREHRGPGSPFSVLLLDFDRPSNCRGGPAEWFSELTRQLGLGNATLTQRMKQLRYQAAQKVPVAPGGSPIGGHVVAEEIHKGLASALAEQQAAGRPLLVVLDTFEEVLTRSDLTNTNHNLFSEVLRWAAELQAIVDFKNSGVPAFSAVRIIVSGRVSPELGDGLKDWFCGAMPIGPLDPAAACAFLQRRDTGNLLDDGQVQRAVEVLGGHPLSLILFERFVRQQPGAVEEVLSQGDLSRMMSGEDAARSLYSRFLQRLHIEQRGGKPVDPEKVRRIAHPGLVLREVTAEHIAAIIAPGCEVVLEPREAEALFDRLTEQVWLVEQVAGRVPRTVRHRADVRRLMLPMMSGLPGPDTDPALGDSVCRVRRLAVDWFAARSAAPLDEIHVEAAYHRAFLDQIDDIHDAALWKLVWNLAPDDVPAMPPRAAALVRYHGRGASSLSREQTEALPEGLRSSVAVEQTSESIAAGHIDEAAWFATMVQPDSAAGQGTAMSPAANSRPRPSLYEMARDRALAAEINSAFHSGDYARAASIGWGAIEWAAETSLNYPLPIEEDITSHWIWRAAIARMISPEQVPDMAWLEMKLERLLSPDGMRLFDLRSAGLVLAAAIYIASAGRCAIPRMGAEGLARLAQQSKFLNTPGDARLLSLAAAASGRDLKLDLRVQEQLLPAGAVQPGSYVFPFLPRNRLRPRPGAFAGTRAQRRTDGYHCLNARLPEFQSLVLAITGPLIQNDPKRLSDAVGRMQLIFPDWAPAALELDSRYLATRMGRSVGSHSPIASVISAADEQGVLPHLLYALRQAGEPREELAKLSELVNLYSWLLGVEFD